MAAIKSKYKLWMCTSTALLREDKLHYGLKCSSLRIEYHYRNALALFTSLYNKAKHGRLTKTLLEHQTQQLKTATQGHLGPQCQTPRYLQKQLQCMLRARQYISIQNSNLRFTLQGQSILTESFDSITKALRAPNLPTLETLINKIAFPLMGSGISSLSRLLSLDGTHILNGNNLKFKFGSKIKTGQIIAINRLASLLNSENITPQLISDLHKSKDTAPSKEDRAPSRRINATALDAIKAYTPIGWAWSDVQVSQRQQTQTPARRTVSTRRTRRTIQRQTESMNIDAGCSNTQPNNPSRQTRTNNNPPSSQPNKRQKKESHPLLGTR